MKHTISTLLQNHDAILEHAKEKAEALDSLVDQYRTKVYEVVYGILKEMHAADEERLYVYQSGFSCKLTFKGNAMVRVVVDKKNGSVAVSVEGTLVYTAIIGSDSIETFREDNQEIQTLKKVILDKFARNLTAYRNEEIQKL